MAFNIFEGARRIAMLTAGLATAISAVAIYFNSEPYVTADFVIVLPDGEFRRTESCPSDAAHHFFNRQTSADKTVHIDLCIYPLTFDKKGPRLIPYKIDSDGTYWGAADYSVEVSDYKNMLEKRFKLPPDDDAALSKEYSKAHMVEIAKAVGVLGLGLAIFGGFVWAVGWIVRGFMGIPRGHDRRPS